MNIVYAIIPAGGIGSRMQSKEPKQFLEIDGKPILIITISKLISTNLISKFIIPTIDIIYTKKLLRFNFPNLDFIICKNGKTRQESIQNAITEIKDLEDQPDLILIHDAVRPLVQKETIEAVIHKGSQTGSAIAAKPVTDTLKLAYHNNGQAFIKKNVSRDYLWQAQTPQVYRREIFYKAYQKAFEDHFEGTDSAGLVERLGQEIALIESPQSNFKITSQEDLKLAKKIL